MSHADEPTCLGCRHYVEVAPPAGAVVIGVTAQAECREGPPQVVALADRSGVQMIALYPRVHGAFPRCSRYESAVVRPVAGG